MAKKVTPVTLELHGRITFPSLFEPKQVNDEGAAKYRATILISKEDKRQLKMVNDTINKLAAEAFGTDAKKVLAKGNPFTDGAEKDQYDGYEESFFLNLSSDRKPSIARLPSMTLVQNPEDIWSGCEVAIKVSFYPYDNVKKGIGAGLGNVLLVKQGDRLDGRKPADQEEWAEYEADEATVDGDEAGEDLLA